MATVKIRRSVYVYKRNKALSLSDDCRNPGALNDGRRARRYGSIGFIEATKGNRTAIFPDFPNGAAALVDLIQSRNGCTIQQYMLGGASNLSKKFVQPRYSYSGGGGDYSGYMKVFKRAGLDPATTLIDADDMPLLVKMVNCHAKGEGGKWRLKEGSIEFKTMCLLLGRLDT